GEPVRRPDRLRRAVVRRGSVAAVPRRGDVPADPPVDRVLVRAGVRRRAAGLRGPLTPTWSGEGGIRTRGPVLPGHRFSKAALSTTQPPLRKAGPGRPSRES